MITQYLTESNCLPPLAILHQYGFSMRCYSSFIWAVMFAYQMHLLHLYSSFRVNSMIRPGWDATGIIVALVCADFDDFCLPAWALGRLVFSEALIVLSYS